MIVKSYEERKIGITKQKIHLLYGENQGQIKDFIDIATSYLKMNVEWIGKGLNEKLINKVSKKVLIKINPKYFRPSEVNILIGDYSKAKKHLKWKPKTNLKKLISIMIDDEIKYYNKL